MFDFSAILDTATVYLLQADVSPAVDPAQAPIRRGTLEYIMNSNVINVLLVSLILFWLFKKFKLLSGFDRKQERISSELQAVENQKREALAQLEEARQRTANLSAEVEEILQNARESAQSLSSQIIADARLESEKIVENARRRVELEQRSAMKELERRLLNEALSDARTELAQTMSASDQKRSVEAFLDELASMKGGR